VVVMMMVVAVVVMVAMTMSVSVNCGGWCLETASLAILARSSNDIAQLLHKRAATHILYTGMRWVMRARMRIRYRKHAVNAVQ
jgi:hypothetical protein